jgi:hypothetical protein
MRKSRKTRYFGERHMEGLGFEERGKLESSGFKPLRLKTPDSGFRRNDGQVDNFSKFP